MYKLHKLPSSDSDEVSIAFVARVKQFPVLYDFNAPDYGNKNEQNKAWKQIAAEFQGTEKDCKVRWKHIRGALTRYLKAKKKPGSEKKPYYLVDHLNFLRPFLRTQQWPNELNVTQSDLNLTQSDFNLTKSDLNFKQSSQAQIERLNPREKVATQYLEKNDYIMVEDADLDFFKSLLPDIKHFSPARKRLFKRKVIEIIDELSEDDLTAQVISTEYYST